MITIAYYLLWAVFILKDCLSAIIVLVALYPFVDQIVGGGVFYIIFITFSALKSFNRIVRICHKITPPLAVSFTMMAISALLSNLLGEYSHPLIMVRTIFVQVLMVWMFWIALIIKREKGVRLYIKTCVIFAVVVAVTTVIELFEGDNIIIKYLYAIDNFYMYNGLVTGIRYGIKRCQSIFDVHMTLGMTGCILFIILSYAYKYKYIKRNLVSLLLIILMGVCCFASGCRSAIMGLVVSSLGILNFRSIKPIWIVVMGLVIVLIAPLSSYFLEVFDSFRDTSSVGGSDSDMREVQFTISYNFMMRSPIIGNGLAYIWQHVQTIDGEIFGAESLWFPLMVDQGLLGVVSFVLFFISLCLYCFKRELYSLLWFVFGMLVMGTLASLPHYSITLIATTVFAVERMRNNYKKQEVIRRNAKRNHISI